MKIFKIIRGITSLLVMFFCISVTAQEAKTLDELLEMIESSALSLLLLGHRVLARRAFPFCRARLRYRHSAVHRGQTARGEHREFPVSPVGVCTSEYIDLCQDLTVEEILTMKDVSVHHQLVAKQKCLWKDMKIKDTRQLDHTHVTL